MKKIISACVAFILSFFVVNGIMFAYERPVAWIDTPNGASRAVRNPNAMLIHGTEGYSISKIDSNGFTNQNYALADEYILMMGASHSQGKEITISSRYSTIVNNMLVDDKEVFRILPRIRRIFGADGILICPAGLGIMFIFLLAVAEQVRGRRTVICL